MELKTPQRLSERARDTFRDTSMGVLKIGNTEFITADTDKLEIQEMTEQDLNLNRDEVLEYKRRVYRRYEPNRDPIYYKWKQTRRYAWKKGVDLPLSYEDFADLLQRSPVEDENGRLTCLYSLVERRDGSTSFHPYKGGIQIKYLGRLVLDTSY